MHLLIERSTRGKFNPASYDRKWPYLWDQLCHTRRNRKTWATTPQQIAVKHRKFNNECQPEQTCFFLTLKHRSRIYLGTPNLNSYSFIYLQLVLSVQFVVHFVLFCCGPMGLWVSSRSTKVDGSCHKHRWKKNTNTIRCGGYLGSRRSHVQLMAMAHWVRFVHWNIVLGIEASSETKTNRAQTRKNSDSELRSRRLTACKPIFLFCLSEFEPVANGCYSCGVSAAVAAAATAVAAIAPKMHTFTRAHTHSQPYHDSRMLH